MVINQAEMMKRTKCSADPTVDVCAIEVGDLLVQHITAGEKTGVQYMAFGGISKEMFAGNNKITVEAGDAVLVAGYPKGYYDDVNLFPVLKAATRERCGNDVFQRFQYTALTQQWTELRPGCWVA
jgi:hypothetical protein